VRDAEVKRKMKEENEGVCRTLHVHQNGFQNGVEPLIAHEPRLRQQIAGTIQGLNVHVDRDTPRDA